MTDGHILSLKEKPVLTTDLFTVNETTLTLDTGNTVVHHNIARRPTVIVFPLTPKYEIYLISQYRYLYKKKLLEVIAGFVEGGENPLTTARKELREEGGIEANQLEEFARLQLMASVVKATTHFFVARDLTVGIAHPEEDEDIELIKMPLSDAVAKVMSGEINTSSSVAGILLLDKLRKEKKL